MGVLGNLWAAETRGIDRARNVVRGAADAASDAAGVGSGWLTSQILKLIPPTVAPEQGRKIPMINTYDIGPLNIGKRKGPPRPQALNAGEYQRYHHGPTFEGKEGMSADEKAAAWRENFLRNRSKGV